MAALANDSEKREWQDQTWDSEIWTLKLQSVEVSSLPRGDEPKLVEAGQYHKMVTKLVIFTLYYSPASNPLAITNGVMPGVYPSWMGAMEAR